MALVDQRALTDARHEWHVEAAWEVLVAVTAGPAEDVDGDLHARPGDESALHRLLHTGDGPAASRTGLFSGVRSAKLQ